MAERELIHGRTIAEWEDAVASVECADQVYPGWIMWRLNQNYVERRYNAVLAKYAPGWYCRFRGDDQAPHFFQDWDNPPDVKNLTAHLLLELEARDG